MKFLIIIATVIALSQAKVVLQTHINDELDTFFDQALIEGNTSFLRLFSELTAFLEPKARDTRTAYATYQQSVYRFPFDQLTTNTRNSFENLVTIVDNYISQTIGTLEGRALDIVWNKDSTTSQRGPNTPSEDVLNGYLRMDIENMKQNFALADETCAASLFPQLIPHYQQYVDAISAAAVNQITTIPSRFTHSYGMIMQSNEATAQFVNYIDLCAIVTNSENCITNWMEVYYHCSSCRFLESFGLPSGQIQIDSYDLNNAYVHAKDNAFAILSSNPILTDVINCRPKM